MSDSPPLIIAIDGPAASGKSTVARRVATALDGVFVNSGGMYRAFTWWVAHRGIDPQETAAVLALLDETHFSCSEENGVAIIAIDGEVLDAAKLSEPSVNQQVSVIASIPEVRSRLVAEQRAYAARSGTLVMEGRDIGSVVFPETPYKFYIDASPEVREARRQAEGIHDAIATRDKIDSSRKTSPLVIAEDATVVDSSHLGIDEVVAAVLDSIAARKSMR
jgi:cytidylate kinase